MVCLRGGSALGATETLERTLLLSDARALCARTEPITAFPTPCSLLLSVASSPGNGARGATPFTLTHFHSVEIAKDHKKRWAERISWPTVFLTREIYTIGLKRGVSNFCVCESRAETAFEEKESRDCLCGTPHTRQECRKRRRATAWSSPSRYLFCDS